MHGAHKTMGREGSGVLLFFVLPRIADRHAAQKRKSSCARVGSNRVHPFATLSDVDGRAGRTTDGERKGEGTDEKGGGEEGGGRGQEEGRRASSAGVARGVEADAQVPLASAPDKLHSRRRSFEPRLIREY